MSTEEDLTRKIQGLLAKAEGTDNAAEAEAFYAKAEELMLRYAIDEARIRAFAQGKADADKPIMDTFVYSTTDNNAVGKMRLMHAVADGHRVKMVLNTNGSSKRVRSCFLVGFRRDVDFAKMLFGSLLVDSMRQASTTYERVGLWNHEILAYEAGRLQRCQSCGERVRRVNRTWRHVEDRGKSAYVTSFLSGYSRTIRERLEELHRVVRQDDPSGMALVDMTKQRIDQAAADFIGEMKPSKIRTTADNMGWLRGRKAGESADIGMDRVRGAQPRIGSGS